MALLVDCIDLELKRHVTEENITKEIKNHEITFKKGGTRQNSDREIYCQNLDVKILVCMYTSVMSVKF